MKIMVLRYVYGYASALLRARAPITAGILLAVLGTACLHTMPTQWRVGAARVDITPDAAEIAAGNIWLGGFGSCLLDSRRATGVHDPIHARAMVISDGATTVAHVMADTPGISNRRIKAIRQRAFDATGIPRSNIMVGATHTHSGPDMVGIWCGVSDSYESSFDQRVAQAVIEAHQSLQPATLLARVAPLSNMQTNRRGWNITDEDLAVLQARDSDDRPIGTIVEFAAHATCIGKENTLISRDWVGRVQDRIEGSGNGIALVNTGDQGDVIPKDCGSGFGGAEAFGASIADAARDRIATAEELTPP
ncbi:MAG TPA: hypothetical protein DCO77_11555, partial [Nitrospiraceae bacterium]|nr:hypothetical protein [Nitrospiraceae bacterium]